jgi:hypothetical protein
VQRTVHAGWVLGALLLAACGAPDPPDAAGADARRTIGATIALEPDEDARLVSGGTGTIDIQYQPSARLVARDEVIRSLAGVSRDGWILHFKPAGDGLRALEPGDVLVVKGLFARKVLAVEHTGDSVSLLTAGAELGEVIRDGAIRFKAPIRFSPDARAGQPMSRRRGHPLWPIGITDAHAQDVAKEAASLYNSATKYGKKAVGALANDWQVVYSAVPGDGRIDLSIQLTREHHGFRGLITGKGYLQDFDLGADIGVERSVVQRLEANFERVNGVMNFFWEVGMEAPAGYAQETRIKLPGAISIPLYQMLDGFPLFLEISSAMIIQPVITGGQQYTHGAFRVGWDGYQHLTAKAGNIDPAGNVTGEILLVNERTFSALAPLGMVINMAAPRIELSMNPLRMLGELSGSTLDGALAAAGKQLDEIAARLIEKARGTSLGARIPPELGGVGLAQVANAMKSDAMAYIQLITTAATAASGSSALFPCTRVELAITGSVGASAQAFGQQVGHVSKTILERKLAWSDAPGNTLCNPETGAPWVRQ